MVRISFPLAAMLLACAAFLNLSALAQSSQGRNAKTEGEVKFEVLSIRSVQPGSPPTSFNFAPTPNGFDSTLSAWQMIMVAYGPVNASGWGSLQILNTPKWIGDFYVINARVSQADLKAWQSQSGEHELLRSAMRAALKERFHLAIHEQPSTGRIFELVLAKGGPHLKAAAPDSPVPVGVKLPGGGVMVGKRLADGKTVWDCHAVSMQDLTWYLNIASQPIPVRDSTGLTGRYDFALRQVDRSPDEDRVYSWPIDHLGLKLKPGTESRPNFVVDHIDRPTAN